MTAPKWIIGRLAMLVAGLVIAQSLYLPAKAVAAQALLHLAWQRTLATGIQHKPWPWADTATLARINFPELEGELILLAGSMGRTLAFAPGHMSGSSLPDGKGHMVISGHRDTHFAMLENIQMGHRIEIEDRTGHLKTYRVNDIRIVDSRNEQVILAHDKERLTLITCYPFDAIQAGGPLRLRIDAELVLSDVS